MKCFIYSIALLLTVACGAKVDHSGHVKHEMVINTQSLEKYFRASCEKKLAPLYPTEEQIEECTIAAVGAFFEFLEGTAATTE